MASTITAEMIIEDVVRRFPQTEAVFLRHNVDTC